MKLAGSKFCQVTAATNACSAAAAAANACSAAATAAEKTTRSHRGKNFHEFRFYFESSL